MRSVRVRLLVDDFSVAMRAIGEWLDANGYLPTRYKYDHYDDAILVTVDFAAEAAAEAFAALVAGTGQVSIATHRLGNEDG